MRKLISVLLAVLMSASVLTVAAVPAMASINSPAPVVIDDDAKPTVEVNGEVTSTDVIYTPDDNDHTVITFEYVGDGDLTGWDDNLEELGLVPGTDYTAVMQPDGKYTITFISDDAILAWNNGKVVVNAIVDFPSTTEAAKKDDSSKSPKTGSATLVAATFAAAGAGFAVLSAKKKRDDAE